MRGEDISPTLGQPGEDLRQLLRRLPLPKDHLRHAGAQGAVVIELGKA